MKYLLSVLFLLSASSAFSVDNVTVPNKFQAGDIVSASKMNQNFQQLADEITKLRAALASPSRPSIGSVTPELGATNVSLSSNITINFSEAMDVSTIATANTLTGSNITLQDSRGKNIQGAITYSNQVATFNPTNDLKYSETYTVTISTSVANSAGILLGIPYSWSFQTVLNTPASISAGQSHTCATYFDNTVKCSGANSQGSLGNGTGLISLSPVNVTGITNATTVSTSSDYSCALLDDNTIRCWGQGWSGVMGDGSGTNWFVPANRVSGITTATDVSTSPRHACALLGDGTVQCWGSNSYGSLGGGSDNISTQERTPIVVNGISNATSITSGQSPDDYSGYLWEMGYSCALLSTGTIKCWGGDGHGQLGSGSRNTTSYTPAYSNSSQQTGYFSREPVQVVGISNATAISASRTSWRGHTCAIVDGGSVKCWGNDDYGQLGSGSRNTQNTKMCESCSTGTYYFSPTPVAVTGISTATAISAGGQHTCALLADKTIKCWGADWQGQLGSGSKNTETVTNGSNTYTQEMSFTPVAVSGINTAIAVSAGGQHTCALLEDKTVKCWGDNSQGQYGDGLGASSSAPVLSLF